MRKGWQTGETTVLDLAPACEEAGAAVITVHGRTRDQFYSGTADWEIIKSVQKRLSIPLVGNGDISTPQDGEKIFNKTGCQGS